jgi:hypothetical protein
MPVPIGTDPQLSEFLSDLDERLAALEGAGNPVLVPAFTTALMPSATLWKNRVILNTTLNILAHSDGTNWKRQDTGASI